MPTPAAQMVPQVAARPEAGEPGDLVDGQVARLEKFAGAVDAAAADPRARRLTGLLAEPAVERARAHVGVPGQPLDGQLLVEMLQRPVAGRGGREWSGAGTCRSMNCAWPPSRHGGTTQYRATALATWAPWSDRMMCRHKSIPAARPAEVSTSPSSTNSTFSSTRTCGCSRRSSSANFQCVVAGRPSSRPAAASTNAPVQIDTSRVPGRIRASAAAHLGRQHAVDAGRRVARAGDDHGVGGRKRLRSGLRARMAKPVVDGDGLRGQRTGHHLVERAAVGVGGGAEQRRRDRGVETDDGRQQQDGDAMHASHFGMFLTTGVIHATGAAGPVGATVIG